ncbi:MAG: hypothetical protein L6300_04105 [Syntrophaceae bacterium]|nr:hypothetical protein [Syntrophaceae bacterium]
MYRFLMILVIFFVSFSLWGKEDLSKDVFTKPKAVIVDEETGNIYVANVNGASAEKDANGYISLLDNDGNVKISRFINGVTSEIALHAPRGMAIVDSTLYVADIDTIKAFNKYTGKYKFHIDLRPNGARLLYGMTVDPQKKIYVSDISKNIIFQIDSQKNNHVEILAQGEKLGSPAGLVWFPGRSELLITTWHTGTILSIDQKGKVRRRLTMSLGKLSDIDYDIFGTIYVPSPSRNKVYCITNRHIVNTCYEDIAEPHAIAVDRQRHKVVVTSLKNNNLSLHKPSYR